MLRASLARRLLCVSVFGCCVLSFVFPTPSSGAEIYEITSTRKDGKKLKYQVTFGGSKTHNRLTAFCPKNKKFVYLVWEASVKPEPKPVSSIWDPRSGETIPLYRFPGSPYPLPAINDISDMKVCPFTGDKKFKKKITKFDD
jgi:hypothetical protein